MTALLVGLVVVLSAKDVCGQAPRTLDLGKPSAKDQVIEVVRGQAIQVVLETDAKSPHAKVEFVVDLPVHGDMPSLLPAIDPRTPTKAYITYQSDPNSKIGVDEFTWKARYLENDNRGEYSAPGRVSIRILEPAPRLEMSNQVYFGHTVIGAETIKELYIKNIGNAPFRQQLKLEAPWRVVKPENPELVLNPGDQTKLEIGFRPEKQGSTTFSWQLQEGPDGAAVLTGSGLLPFRPDETTVELEYQSESRDRIGELHLYGLSPGTVSVDIDTDSRLRQGSETVAIPSGGKEGFTFHLPPEDGKAYEGYITLKSGPFSTRVKVIAAAAPAFIEVQMPDNVTSVDFGEVVPGIALKHPFRVTNLGGSDAILNILLPPPFELLSPDSSNVLRPGRSRDYTVLFSTKEGSRSAVHRTELAIRSGTQRLNYQVNAVVKAPEITPQVNSSARPRNTSLPSLGNATAVRNPLPSLPRPPPAPIADEDDPRRTPLGFITEDLEQRQYSNRVQPVPAFDLVEQRRRSLKIGWPLPASTQRQFVVDMRQTRYNEETHAIDSVWTPWANTEFTIEKGDDGPESEHVVAEVRGLEPNTIYEMRVVSITEDGRYAPPSETLGIITAMPIDWTWFERIVILCVLALIGWLGWRWHKSRQF